MRNFLSKKRTYLLPLIIFLGTTSVFSKLESSEKNLRYEVSHLYNELELSRLGLSSEVFSKALSGWKSLTEKQRLDKPGVLSIADLSQSSNSKRLYIIDVTGRKVLFTTYVAHGRNSGEEFAHSFSNQPESHKSSLGFYLTENTYYGAHGLSLKLKGIEKGINDVAEERGIVIHGAPYVSEKFINEFGRLGRSQGCPAIPEELCSPIVNSIKEGSCFFMFYPDSTYFRSSELL